MAGVIAVISPERRIKQNPFDVEAWMLVLRDVQRKKIDSVRSFYEALVKQFPNAGRFWRAYAEHEIASGNYKHAEAILQRCLVKVLNIDLWKCYVKFVRTTKGNTPSFREKMAEVYDFALEKVGLDFYSSQLYTDYISFLKSVPAAGSYAENQKISAVRRVYHRALATPIAHLEQIWVEYCSFEKNVNAYLAEKLISEKSREYQQSRRVSRLMESATRGLNRNLVSVPPRNTPQEVRQHRLWKAFIKWEMSNPTQTEDQVLYTKRIIFAYEQALLCMGFHSDLWYEASLYMQEASRRLLEKGDSKFSNYLSDYTTALMNRAISFVWNNNVLLHFAYADYEEEKMHFEKVNSLYMKVLANQNVDPTLVYIQLMRFLRRREGIMGARAVFSKARQDNRCNWHAYVAAAQMEYTCAKDRVIPRKIYELTLKKFPYAYKVLLNYADYLITLNDVEGVRDLFEKVLNSNAPYSLDAFIEIWDRYLDYESYVGEFHRVRHLRRRRYEALQRRFGIGRTPGLIDQYRHEGLLPCEMEQLPLAGFLMINLPYDRSLCKIRSEMPKWMLDPYGSIPRPARDQLAPFKPKLDARAIATTFKSPPPTVAHLLNAIPSLSYFRGPMVDVEKLMHCFEELDLTNSAIVQWESEEKKSTYLDKIKQEFGMLRSSSKQPYRSLYQLKSVTQTSDDSENEMDEANRAPLDLYRLRRRMKMSMI